MLERHGITPITSDEAIMPGESWMIKSEALIKEASMVIVDISGNDDTIKWELVSVRNLQKQLIIIGEEERPYYGLASLEDQRYITYEPYGDNRAFVEKLDYVLDEIDKSNHQEFECEPFRLLEKKEYDAAVISVFRLLEITLRKSVACEPINTIRPVSLFQMLRQLYIETQADLVEKILSYVRVRNEIVHGIKVGIDKKLATEIVDSCLQLINTI